jgi:hypothetical protein
VARRPDGQTVFIHVCEHPEPVRELRRIHDTVSGTLGHRTLQAFQGADIVQLKILLHLLGYLDADPLDLAEPERGLYGAATAQAVDRLRTDAGLAGPAMGVPSGLVDHETVAALWAALERADLVQEARRRIRPYTQIRR